MLPSVLTQKRKEPGGGWGVCLPSNIVDGTQGKEGVLYSLLRSCSWDPKTSNPWEDSDIKEKVNEIEEMKDAISVRTSNTEIGASLTMRADGGFNHGGCHNQGTFCL